MNLAEPANEKHDQTWWWVMLFLLFSVPLPGQKPIYFSNLSMREGLPSNIGSAIAQDQFDFIWIGTGSGLARFDGYHTTVFRKDNTANSLPSNEISCLLTDGDYLWVGTWHGLYRLHIKTFAIENVTLPSDVAVRALYQSEDWSMWVGTSAGLFRIGTDLGTIAYYDDQNSGLSHKTVRTLYETGSSLWVGTYDKLNRLDLITDSIAVYDLRKGNIKSPANHLILDIYPAGDENNLLVGTETGLYQLDLSTGHSAPYFNDPDLLSNQVIKCIHSDQSGRLWLGTDFGLNIYDPQTKTMTAYFQNPQVPYSLANNVIWQIMEDRSGIIWLVTSNGISRIHPDGNFYEYHDISHVEKGQIVGNQVKSLLISSTGAYWLATQNGVIRIDPVSGSKRLFSTTSAPDQQLLLNNVFALEEDRLGRIWIGTAGGLNIWDPTTQKMASVTADVSNGLNTNYIGNITNAAGEMWISAWEGGLYKVVDPSVGPPAIRFEKVPALNSDSEKIVYGDGAIWILEYQALYRVDPMSLRAESIPTFNEVSADQVIYAVYFSKAGHVWASTVNGLIQYFPEEEKGVFHQVFTGEDMIISSLVEDDAGNIWGASNSFILKVDPVSEQTEKYPLDKDLPLKSFYYGCAAKDEVGNLFFGGDNGYLTFSPDQVHSESFQPPVYITNIQVNNQDLSVSPSKREAGLQQDAAFTEILTLQYSQNNVTFEFSALNFRQPTLNTYAYRLAGLQEDWQYVSGNQNIAVYSNLPSGTYEFIVRAIDKDGMEADSSAVLQLTIKPPLWLSPWMLLLYALSIILIGYYTLRFYFGRLHLRNELKIVKLEKEHNEEVERIKEKFFTNISHELRTPISLILPPIRETLGKGTLDEHDRKLISLAEKNAIRLKRLVNQILDLNKLESESLQLKVEPAELVGYVREIGRLFVDHAERNHIDFRFESSIERQDVWIDTEKMETVLFNLLSNAFKFTDQGGMVRLRVDLYQSPEEQESYARIRISDTGVGIAPEDMTRIFDRFYQTEAGQQMGSSTGIGLTLVAEYVNLHRGRIDVDSFPGRGTTFSILLPIGKAHFPIDSIEEKEIMLKATPSVYAGQQDGFPYLVELASGKPTLLLVEDNFDVIEFITTSLGEKYNFVIAQHGKEGLAKARQFLPEVIISDIMMPVMDGLEFCQRIKEDPKTSHITIILLTAKTLESARLEGVRRGADVYLTKPFEVRLLEAHIDNLIQRKKELGEYFRDELMLVQSPPETKNQQDQVFLRKVTDLIEANVGDADFSVEQLSHEIGLSATQLYRKLKEMTGHSAQDLIRKYRIKKASLLLRNSDEHIAQVMYQVGFSSSSYFSKCFKAEFGMTPKAFQRRCQTETGK